MLIFLFPLRFGSDVVMVPPPPPKKQKTAPGSGAQSEKVTEVSTLPKKPKSPPRVVKLLQAKAKAPPAAPGSSSKHVSNAQVSLVCEVLHTIVAPEPMFELLANRTSVVYYSVLIFLY